MGVEEKVEATLIRREKAMREIMRFCQSFMTELCKYIGPGY